MRAWRVPIKREIRAGINSGTGLISAVMKVFKAWIYILRLESGMFYVGWTTNIKRRVQAHINGKGALATRQSKPVALQGYFSLGEVTDWEAMEAESIVTLELVKKYGNHKVIGGDYCGIVKRGRLEAGVEMKLLEAKRRARTLEEWRKYGGYDIKGRQFGDLLSY